MNVRFVEVVAVSASKLKPFKEAKPNLYLLRAL